MHLQGDPDSPRLVTGRSKIDHTKRMITWARKRVKELEREDLCGFIFKSRSPSSGMERVRVYNEKGIPEKKGVGMFARIFMEHFPVLPVEEDGRLHDIKLRENFIERIFALKRWRDLLDEKGAGGGWSPSTRSISCSFYLTARSIPVSWENWWRKPRASLQNSYTRNIKLCLWRP
jgi:hypothetical protein